MVCYMVGAASSTLGFENTGLGRLFKNVFLIIFTLCSIKPSSLLGSEVAEAGADLRGL